MGVGNGLGGTAVNSPTHVVEKLKVQCCIVGGGPAGMMLGFLLARTGISVIVARKARRFSARFSRRYHSSINPPDHVRVGPSE